MQPEQATVQVNFRRFLLNFLGLGTWGFGGPVATVGLCIATWSKYLRCRGLLSTVDNS